MRALPWAEKVLGSGHCSQSARQQHLCWDKVLEDLRGFYSPPIKDLWLPLFPPQVTKFPIANCMGRPRLSCGTGWHLGSFWVVLQLRLLPLSADLGLNSHGPDKTVQRLFLSLQSFIFCVPCRAGPISRGALLGSELSEAPVSS